MANHLLGKDAAYVDQYAPELLFPISRQDSRDGLGITGELPFSGLDRWNAYEISWLNPKGKPVVAVGEFAFPIDSPNLVESKSFKLYLNSLNGMHYGSFEAVRELLMGDLGRTCGAPVGVTLTPVASDRLAPLAPLPGTCIDSLEIATDCYDVNASELEGSATPGATVEESLHSHLLRSNCPVTNQPDWASVLIRYRGSPINHEALLKYLVSYRNHNDFHEQCVERIFMDINHHCTPEALTVYAAYTRRGGLDINPFRSNFENPPASARVWRQ